jgi:hypothetical protein
LDCEFCEIADEDAVTYFTLSAADLSWLEDFNRQQNRLGAAVQLSALPWLGWMPDDLAGCPPLALDRLAEIGRRSTNQALQRAAVDRRHPVLLATLAETNVEVLDGLVQLLDQALAGADSLARQKRSQRLVDRAKAEIDRRRPLDEILDVLADPTVSDEQAGRVVRQRVGMHTHPRVAVAKSQNSQIRSVAKPTPIKTD